MNPLQITLFGSVSVLCPHDPQPMQAVRMSHGTQAIFAYLLLQPHLVSRDVLMDVFWVDHSPDRARSNLTTALWRLRHLLEPDDVTPGTYLVAGSMGEVGFNWESNHFLDSESFEQHIYPVLRKSNADLTESDINEIETVLKLYRGDLLEGMYEDWALRERERFWSLHLNCLTRLMECYASRKSFERSIALGQEILRRDPVREEIHRALMHIYLEIGQRTLAMRQYGQCRDVLRNELGVAPLEETTTLYRRIVSSTSAGTQESGCPPCSQEVAQLVNELHRVKQSLLETTRTLDRINQAVAGFTSAQ